MTVDFGLTANDYARHRAGFPESFFERGATFGVGLAGQKIVDLGTGTGTLARGFAGRGCTVIGIDAAANMLEQAKQMSAADGVTVEYRVATAEATGLPDVSADVVSAGQCWHWFDGNAAARECYRLLRRNGKVIIGHFDWIPLKGNVVEATESLIQAYNPAWKLGGGSGVYPLWPRHLAENGFVNLEIFTYDTFPVYSHEAWRGRIRASAGIGASLPPEKVAAFDTELAEILRTRFPDDPMPVHHRVFALIGQKPA
ncbi:MAG: methyltransferase domain-containing protein [Anaerolineaceae bacterium]|nr:methyltransferase domain-containing protein [Anaerolineaceae bacterium]